MPVQIGMSTGKKFIVFCDYESVAISACQCFSDDVSVDFSVGLNCLETAHPTGPLFIMPGCKQLSVAVDEHRMPIACRYDLRLHFERNESRNRYIFANQSKSVVFGCSPSI